jgi:hypothetical protein
MTDDELAQLVRHGTGMDQHGAALQLATRGGHDLLGIIAADIAAPTVARVTALRYADAGKVSSVVGTLLSDSVPVIRLIALEKIKEGSLREHMPRVEKLIDDPAQIVDLEDTFVVGVVAREVLATLGASTKRE